MICFVRGWRLRPGAVGIHAKRRGRLRSRGQGGPSPASTAGRADGARVVHPGHGQAGWRASGPGTVVGGLTEEGGNGELPEWLALVARR
jgi:hypothetical protein